MSGSPRLLIVGAGPTGLTAAVELARQGILPRIVDRKKGPTPLSKAVGISPHSLDLLEPSKVAERLLDAGLRIRHAHIWYEGQKLGAVDFSALDHRFNFLLSLPQSDTESIMAEVLSGYGVRVEWQVAMTGLQIEGAEIHASLDGAAGREQARFDIVFGADGVHSTVREAAGLGFEGYTHRRLWSISDIELAEWRYEALAAHLFLHSNGDLGFIIPIGPHRYRIVSNTVDALAQMPTCGKAIRVLRGDQFHIPIRQAKSYQRGGVFLGGDAAHVHSPVGARGMNLGIEDAANFARRFVQNTLDGYTAERRPIGARWIKLSEHILATAQLRNRFAVATRNVGIRTVAHVAPLQRLLLKRFAGLKE